jgi:hypothetical protein
MASPELFIITEFDCTLTEFVLDKLMFQITVRKILLFCKDFAKTGLVRKYFLQHGLTDSFQDGNHVLTFSVRIEKN